MPVIVMASPKGGVGKSTCAVLLASEFARMKADVTVLDCDPNKSLTRWASHGLPSGDPQERDRSFRDRSHYSERRWRRQDRHCGLGGCCVPARQSRDLSSRPGDRPDATDSTDAEIGSEALALVREEEEALGRSIRHAVVLTKTSAAVKSRVQKELEEQLRGAGIDVIEPSLVARAAFSELFAYGRDLTAMMNDPEMMTGGKVDKALINAQAFAEAVYERLK